MEIKLSYKQIMNFMIESNTIEGEPGVASNQMAAADYFLDGPTEQDRLLICHGLLTSHLGVDWGGKYRKVNVSVGGNICPSHEDVQLHMYRFFHTINIYSPFINYIRYEKIHPFRDYNGRTGRLIWLHQMLKLGLYNPDLLFLNSFHCQAIRETDFD
jgi:Fic family protein